ncbi:hypothetical protein TIFTF001_031390 [Ficus carica]|uniref:Uncharacterized protein n=1 Tax=Ficus carica TaxID=3494 RepID=A0AA88DV78_FICCA|nr:hypothetical protein TIFTF001_031390 [Ficus carica]
MSLYSFRLSRTLSRRRSIVDHSDCRRDLPTVRVTGMIHSIEVGDDIEAAEHANMLGEKIPATRLGRDRNMMKEYVKRHNTKKKELVYLYHAKFNIWKRGTVSSGLLYTGMSLYQNLLSFSFSAGEKPPKTGVNENDGEK